MAPEVRELAWLVTGCAAGGVARFWISGLIGRLRGETFPLGTMFVNVVGSFAAGLAAAVAATGAGWLADPAGWRFAVTGFLGCFTTVSSFSLQTLALARDGETRLAAVNVLGSVALCLACAAAGLAIGTLGLGGR